MRPQYKRPYYYIHNVNKDSNIPTDPYTEDSYSTWDKNEYDYSICERNDVTAPVGSQGTGTDITEANNYNNCDGSTNKFAGGGPTDNENARELADIIKDKSNRENAQTIILNPKAGQPDSNPVEKVGKVRYGNASKVRLEIRYGKDNSLFELTNIWVDYIKSPQYIRLTQEQLDLTEDTSQKMEFPDYVCQEIINELVHIVMENSSDPRMQTHPAFS